MGEDMTLPLNPETLKAAYIFLNETPPFNKWNLPDADEIRFKVVRSEANQGWHTFDGKRHLIAVSSNAIGHTFSLIALMAHEIVHVHENNSGICRADVEHSAAFWKWAEQVCRIHGFDPKTF